MGKIIKHCIICDTEFSTYNKKAMCCSYKCGRIKQWQNPEYRTNKIKELSLNQTPERRKANSEFHKEYQNRPDIKIMMSNIQKVVQNKGDVNERRSIKSKEMWSNLDHSQKFFNSCHKYKDFILPSGKIVKLQGFEPRVLKELLKIYDENDIVIGIKPIHAELGFITYTYNNKTYKYFPDFYIKSINKIIEVKSTYTYQIHKEINELKREACVDKGLDFEFIILK